MSIYKNIAIGAALGAISGVVGAGLSSLGVKIDLFYIITGGISFGLCFGMGTKWRFGLGYIGVLLLTLLSPALYYAGVWSAVMVHGTIKTGNEMTFPGLVGGAAGAFLVVVLSALLLPKLRHIGAVALVTIVGAVTGAVALPVINMTGSDMLELAVLQASWQAAVLATLFGILSRHSLPD